MISQIWGKKWAKYKNSDLAGVLKWEKDYPNYREVTEEWSKPE